MNNPNPNQVLALIRIPQAILASRIALPALIAASLLAATLAAYGNALDCGFVLDDTAVVRDNPLIRSLGGIPRLFRENYWAPIDSSNLYRPVTVASYAVNRAVLGPGPRGFHAVNLALHLGVSCLLFALARALGLGRGPSLLAALVFAVHPIHGEAVTGIVGRAELLAAAGALTALLAHVAASARTGGLRLALFAAAAAAAGLGLFAKESALGALAALPACDLARRRRPNPAGGGLGGDRVRLLPCLGYGLAVLVYALSRLQVLGAERAFGPARLARIDNPLVVETLIPRWLTAFSLVPRYLGTTLWPRTLSADHSYAQVPVVRSPADPQAALGAALLALAALGLVAAVRRGRPAEATALGLFLGSYLVVSNLAVSIGALYAERFFYLPSAGLFLLGAAVLDRPPLTAPDPAAAARGSSVPILGIALALVLPLLAARSWLRNRDWRDEPTLLRRTVATAPRSIRAHAYLARSLAAQDRPAEARAELEQALAIDPAEAWTWNQLAELLLDRDPVAAEHAVRRSIALHPRFADPHYNRGRLELGRGQPEEAVPALREALRLRPDHVPARLALADAYLALGRPDWARPEVEQAFALRPDLASVQEMRARVIAGGAPASLPAGGAPASLAAPGGGELDAFALGRRHESLGRLEEAIADYRRAALADPPPLEAFTRQAALLATLGRRDEAETALAEASRRLGPSATLENNRGTLALLGGDRAAARAAWERALRLEPGNDFARRRLAALGDAR